ncbi:MAG: hypothetical protein J7M12_05645 [Candidatus Hydrogenedentes bacterium]|nr:hypothetical protein [Candidatus Hydrogenedentota bacterium]
MASPDYFKNLFPRGFHPFSESPAYAVLRDDAPEACRAFLLRSWPRDLMRSPDTPVGRIPLEILDLDDQQYLKRWYTHGGLLGPLFGGLFFGTSRPFRELDTATYAVACGVPTVDPIGACVWKIAGPIYRCALLTRRAFGASNMPEFLAKNKHMDTAFRRDLIEQTADAVRRMHDAGIYHADLNLANILVQQTGPNNSDVRILIIDWDRTRVRRRVGIYRRTKNLLRMSRSSVKQARRGVPITQTDRIRFLRAYCAGKYPWVHRLALRGPIKLLYVLKWRVADWIYKLIGRPEPVVQN